MATFAPFAANASAIARPIRLAAPVTSAVFPVNSFSMRSVASRRRLLWWRGVCRGRTLRCGCRRSRSGFGRRRGSYRLLHTRLSLRGLAFVVLVGGDLLLRSKHRNGDLPAGFAHQILLRKGGKTSRDDLYAHLAAGRDHINHGLAVRVCLDFEVTLFFAIQR